MFAALTLVSLVLVADPVTESANIAADDAAAAFESFGYEPLFDGETLDGWIVPEGDNGHWKVVDGVIDYDAASEAEGDKSLRTKDSFGDFICELEWRLMPVGPLQETPIILADGTYLLGPDGKQVKIVRQCPDSGIYLRGEPRAQLNLWNWTTGSGEMYGFRNRAQTELLRSKLTPDFNADKPLGEWNRFTIVLVGRTLTLLVNDHLVIEQAELPEDFPLEGPLVLQHHGGRDADGNLKPSSSVVQFRNIRLKRLAAE